VVKDRLDLDDEVLRAAIQTTLQEQKARGRREDKQPYSTLTACSLCHRPMQITAKRCLYCATELSAR
jgi:cytochrome c553